MSRYHRFPHVYPTNDSVNDLMQEISVCREDTCPIVQRQPVFPTPNDPPLFHGNRPCSPVVPTRLARGKIMLIGSYPNSRFASYPKISNGRNHFLPSDNINEPFEGGRYFDGFGVRDYPTADSLRTYYLEPLGIDLDGVVWLTNMVKCFLMREKQVESYVDVGWIAEDAPQPQATYDDYFDVAEVCWRRHLVHEIEACDPALILTFGGKVFDMIQGHNVNASGVDYPALHELAGTPLHAGAPASNLDTRIDPFGSRNVVHFFHPSYLLRDFPRSVTARQTHLTVHVPNTLEFWGDILCGAGDAAGADVHYQRAIDTIERHRAELPNAQERIDVIAAKLGC